MGAGNDSAGSTLRALPRAAKAIPGECAQVFVVLD